MPAGAFGSSLWLLWPAWPSPCACPPGRKWRWPQRVRVCTAGGPDRPREEVDLTPRATSVLIDLRVGAESATIFTNDLTHDYVHENSAYSS